MEVVVVQTAAEMAAVQYLAQVEVVLARITEAVVVLKVVVVERGEVTHQVVAVFLMLGTVMPRAEAMVPATEEELVQIV